jgi:hypothetical protein
MVQLPGDMQRRIRIRCMTVGWDSEREWSESARCEMRKADQMHLEQAAGSNEQQSTVIQELRQRIQLHPNR